MLINPWFCCIKNISKGIFLISDICNNQGTHLKKSATDNVTTCNHIHYFNWPRKKHTPIEVWRKCRKATRTLCDESKYKMLTPLEKWRIDDNKYITSWQWFLSSDLHTLYYREHKTWCKYAQSTNQARRHIEFLTDKKSKFQRTSYSKVWIISLARSTTTHIRVEATGMDFPPDPLVLPLERAEEEGTSYLKLRTDFKQKKPTQMDGFTPYF